MIERILLQTNSTVTTTILQQTSGVSFFDWITNALFQTTATDWIMVAVTLAIVYYARVTIKEGNKARKADSIERQLEKFYNPMYEIMNEAVEQQNEHEKIERIVRVHHESHEKLDEIFLNYGHYLDLIDQDKVRKLLHSPKERGYDRSYPDEGFRDCLLTINAIRLKLWGEYQILTHTPFGAVLEEIERS